MTGERSWLKIWLKKSFKKIEKKLAVINKAIIFALPFRMMDAGNKIER
ncbi:MAG: hypothetical protein Phog2KO_50990 [Phototrophicaceae bacterium]